MHGFKIEPNSRNRKTILTKVSYISNNLAYAGSSYSNLLPIKKRQITLETLLDVRSLGSRGSPETFDISDKYADT